MSQSARINHPFSYLSEKKIINQSIDQSIDTSMDQLLINQLIHQLIKYLHIIMEKCSLSNL